MVEIAPEELPAAQQALRTWLVEHAYDLWWTRGADHARGGFHERLHLDATPTGEPRRARLHPRQMFAYGRAAELGWSGPAGSAVQHALDFFIERYRRADGLYRTCVEVDGAPRDDRAVLYDQAFALLGFAAAFETLDDERPWEAARALHDTLRRRLAHPAGGFEESAPRILPLTANSHMHLLEASLGWMELAQDARWRTLAGEIVELALAHLIDADTGVLREFFDASWRPLTDEGRASIEPGHQFEWGGLLLRYASRTADSRAAATGLRLIEIGERRGVDPARGVAVDSVADGGGTPRGQARLWPQTERIKAGCIAAAATGDPVHCRIALEATQALAKYLHTGVRGLWRDRMTQEGEFVEEPAPASSFYHIVGAVTELDRLARTGPWYKTNK